GDTAPPPPPEVWQPPNPRRVAPPPQPVEPAPRPPHSPKLGVDDVELRLRAGIGAGEWEVLPTQEELSDLLHCTTGTLGDVMQRLRRDGVVAKAAIGRGRWVLPGQSGLTGTEGAARRIAERIAAGEWTTTVPGDHGLRRALRIGAGTAVRARALLAAEGILDRRSREGRFGWAPAVSPQQAQAWLDSRPSR
ncbi:MAG: hypothetical protein ACRDQB_06555, partial [Thermocrispum sp.]